MFDLHLWLTFAVQGITEFLPVSSTAHMLLFSKFCQLSPLGVAETAALHLIPGLILLGAFWRDVLEVLQGFGLWIGQTFLYKRNRMTSNKVQTDKTEESHKDASSLSFFKAAFWGTVPALLVGAILGFCHIELPHSIRVIGTNSIIFGVLMGFIDLTTPVLPQKQWDERSGKNLGADAYFGFRAWRKSAGDLPDNRKSPWFFARRIRTFFVFVRDSYPPHGRDFWPLESLE